MPKQTKLPKPPKSQPVPKPVEDIGVPALFQPQDWDLHEELSENEAFIEHAREQENEQ